MRPWSMKSHIHEVPKNNRLIFRVGKVSELWRNTMINMFFFVVLTRAHRPKTNTFPHAHTHAHARTHLTIGEY